MSSGPAQTQQRYSSQTASATVPAASWQQHGVWRGQQGRADSTTNPQPHHPDMLGQVPAPEYADMSSMYNGYSQQQ